MEDKLWEILNKIQREYVEGLITKQERNLKMVDQSVQAAWKEDQKKDATVIMVKRENQHGLHNQQL